MKTYVKNPIAVPAVQLTATNGEAIQNWVSDEGGVANYAFLETPPLLQLLTPNGMVNVTPGDWVAQGTVPGDFYPIANDVFEATYTEHGEVPTPVALQVPALPEDDPLLGVGDPLVDAEAEQASNDPEAPENQPVSTQEYVDDHATGQTESADQGERDAPPVGSSIPVNVQKLD